ncbi:serine/threonine-protein kinase pim-1-like [Zonotrichia leucophrys gambelii]|uniref:serine/threonine-protein kinase pim-1-like n=1 Tax=Zonotrichia leucophrys gambelii TaxID=257770 RepID=UPI00314014DA
MARSRGGGGVYSGTRLADGVPVRDGAGSEGGGGRQEWAASSELSAPLALARRGPSSECAGSASRSGRGWKVSGASKSSRRDGPGGAEARPGTGVPSARRSSGPADGIAVPPQHKGALVPLELALLWMVSWPGFRGIVRLLDWFEVPEGFALVMERPQRCQELWYFLHERRFQTEPVARRCSARGWRRGGTHCSSRRFPRRHIKAENVLVHLATGEAKLIDFGCGTILQDTFYTRMPGMPEYSPPEWILFGCYQGQLATIWSLRILLYELVCGHLPFHPSEDIIWGQLFFPPRVSQECQHLIRWCLSMDPTDRPSLEDLFEHSWLQDPHVAQETAEIHPSAQ